MEEEEYPSLMTKFKNHYHNRPQDPATTLAADRTASTYFWFIAVTQLYVTLRYIVPFYFGNYGEMGIYCWKVAACFVFVNSAANWACTRFYHSILEPTEDRPYLQKRLWDGDDVEKPKNGHVIVECEPEDRHNSISDQIPWEYCPICEIQAPPRTHHCKICRKCILKRDHHCYMSGVCVGFRNQRYFVMLNFYIAIASCGGILLTVSYIHAHFLSESSWWDFFLPFTLWRWLLGSIETKYLFMICHLYTHPITGFMSVSFFVWHMMIIGKGRTSHEILLEIKEKIRMRTTSNLAERFRSVFGSFWFLNFIFPAQILFPQKEDGKSWPHIKIFK